MSDDDTNDEIERIKQAMRISKARQHAFNHSTKQSPPDMVNTDASIFSRRQNDHIVKLETQLMAREEELKYLKIRLDKKERNLEESRKLLEMKAQAVEDEVRQSFAESHAALLHRYRIIEHSAARLLPLITAVERSTMHGRHMIPSETNMSMIMKLKEGVLQITDAISETSCLQIVRSSGKENQSATDNECTQHLDTTLLDICRNLEIENAELRKSLTAGEEKWNRIQDQASKSSLIPQYRAAIVKFRSQTASLEEEVKRLQTWNDHLTAELESAREESRSHKAENTKLKGLLTQAKDERDKYKGTINDMLQHESKDALAREYSMLASQYGINYPRLATASSSVADRYLPHHRNPPRDVHFASSLDSSLGGENSKAAYPHSKLVSTANHERAVERDLAMLDDEIGDLRRRLEVAAVSQTKNVVSEVIEHAAVARDRSEMLL